ncbi:jg5549 [Pararge aegeria aegeria]|uniref:Jg5549 protein n=1 Tax=Pararge aegeria aegeria TaxID=348720 RepID=A0A8S4QDY5_9NEOP|nr:jg5549 [Pararge aegeria aegeria]
MERLDPHTSLQEARSSEEAAREPQAAQFQPEPIAAKGDSQRRSYAEGNRNSLKAHDPQKMQETQNNLYIYVYVNTALI